MIATVEDLAYIFLRNVVANHRMQDEIISDRDKLFTSKFWTILPVCHVIIIINKNLKKKNLVFILTTSI